MGYIYLASPYSHHSEAVREWRFKEACRFVAEFALQGKVVYSPIAHSHPTVQYGTGLGLTFWEAHNTAMLRHAFALWVLELPGWRDSKGVSFEEELAESLNLPVTHIKWQPGANRGPPE